MSSRFSGRGILRAFLTCRSQLLPKMATTGALEATSDWRLGSSSAAIPALRVLPKATSFGMLEPHAGGSLEVGHVLGVGPRPSSLDVVDPELVQPSGYVQLVLGRKRHTLGLGAVPKRGVVERHFSG